MTWIVEVMLGQHMAHGTLTLTFPDGSERRIVRSADPVLRVQITSWSWARRMVANPGLAFGEAYVDGGFVMLEGSIFEFMDSLFAVERRHRGPVLTLRDTLAWLGRRLQQFNPAPIARRNVAHHYDLNGEFYRLLLDADRQYSCAYFRRGDETIDEAQRAKKRHIAKKLLLDRPGLQVLDIGCGWGGTAITLARDYGAEVTGITLSEEQLGVARQRAAEAGLSDRVRFNLLDYRAVTERFDRILSVGMFEHVGINHYRSFFDMIGRCLLPDGVALIHAIGRSDGPRATNAWLGKYIFPGGYSPALSEVLPPLERSGLIATDIEILRLHYAKTLSRWRGNLERHRAAIRALYDERFLRMMEFYLAGAELAFTRTGHMVWQLQLARDQQTVPLTRDYLAG
ncbi:MAG: cyclopropane-fatty-acyl-phospholipid synthase family protein [Acetobacteraceae bacterium]|nr:cyclopropane-fatty-acyl-phospholipid synthase family protein [Acetobacteraceae bacterium]